MFLVTDFLASSNVQVLSALKGDALIRLAVHFGLEI